MSQQFDHRTAVVNGINIHYVIEGQGFPVVLLHGWPETWFSWRKQIPVLAERFQVIVPDMRGFGDSDKPLTGYDTRTAASDIYALVRSLGHQRIAIVGHDIGVRVTYRYCLDHEGEVDRLALLDGTHPLEMLGPQPPEAVRERWHAFFHDSTGSSPAAAAVRLRRSPHKYKAGMERRRSASARQSGGSSYAAAR